MPKKYGLFSSSSPLFVGQEALFVFERKVSLTEITDSFLSIGHASPNSMVAHNYCAIYLGGTDQTFQVFADYKDIPQHGLIWAGGGYGSLSAPGFGTIPGIADMFFGSGESDNWLQLTRNGWYLCVFNPTNTANGLRPGMPSPKTDFYIYRLARGRLPAQDAYGLNVYGPDGTLRYHSGWNILRIHQVQPPNPAISGRLPVLAENYKISGNDRYHMGLDYADAQVSYGNKVFIGHDKLVNIGYCFGFRDFVADRKSSGNAYIAPYIHNGLLGWSVAFFDTGRTMPRDARYVSGVASAEAVYPINPLLVIDKPKV